MFSTATVGMQHAAAEWAKFEITGVVDQQWNGAAPSLLYVQFLDLLFSTVKFLYFQVFHNFHKFTLNWYSQLFQISVFDETLRVLATPHVG